MKVNSLRIFISLSILFTYLLTGCSEVTPVSNTTQTEIPTIHPYGTASPTILLRDTTTPTLRPIVELENIEPDNVNRLEMVDEWGQGNVYGVALSPDEKTIAMATTSGIYLYDSNTLAQNQFIDLPITIQTIGHNNPQQVISFSPDGNLLAIGYEDIIIWDFSNNEIVEWIHNEISDFNIVNLAFSPNGKTIVAMSMGGYAPCDAWGGNYALYDVESQSLLYNAYFCPESALFHFTFTNNGKVVFVGNSAGTKGNGYQVSIVDSITGALLKKLSFDEYVHVDSVSPDGSKISLRKSDESSDAEIIDTNTQKVIGKKEGIIIFLPDTQNQLIATDQDLWTIHANNGKVICNFADKPDINLEVYRSTFTLMGENLIYWNDSTQSVEIWNTANCQLLKQLSKPIIGFTSLKYSPDGSLLATNNWNDIQIRDGETGNYKFSIRGEINNRPSQYFWFGTDGKTIVTVSESEPYIISFWDSITGNEIRSIHTNFKYIQYFDLSPNGNTLAAINLDGIHLWDVKNNKLLTTIAGRFREIYFNPNSETFAVVDGNKIVFRNSQTGEIEKSISTEHEYFGVVFSSDWSFLVVTGEENNELWDLDGNKIREFLEYPPIISNVNSTSLFDVSNRTRYFDIDFNPNHNLFVALIYDYTNYSIHFWDTSTGKIVREIIVPYRVTEVEFSSDGKKLSLLGDGVIYFLGVKEP